MEILGFIVVIAFALVFFIGLFTTPFMRFKDDE